MLHTWFCFHMYNLAHSNIDNKWIKIKQKYENQIFTQKHDTKYFSYDTTFFVTNVALTKFVKMLCSWLDSWIIVDLNRMIKWAISFYRKIARLVSCPIICLCDRHFSWLVYPFGETCSLISLNATTDDILSLDKSKF